MSTGDINNNIQKIHSVLKQLHYDSSNWDISKALLGDPSAFLPLIHFIFLDHSHILAQYIAQRGYELYGKRDARFLSAVYLLLREEFGYKPSLSQKQFLSLGFAERKCLLIQDIFRLAKEKLVELQRSGNKTKASAKTTVSGVKTNENAGIQSVSKYALYIVKPEDSAPKPFAELQIQSNLNSKYPDQLEPLPVDQFSEHNISQMIQAESMSMDESKIFHHSNNDNSSLSAMQLEAHLKRITDLSIDDDFLEPIPEPERKPPLAQFDRIRKLQTSSHTSRDNTHAKRSAFVDEELEAAIYADTSSLIMTQPMKTAPPPERRRDSILTVNDSMVFVNDKRSILVDDPDGSLFNRSFELRKKHNNFSASLPLPQNALEEQRDTIADSRSITSSHMNASQPESLQKKGITPLPKVDAKKEDQLKQTSFPENEYNDMVAVVGRLEHMFAATTEIGDTLATRLAKLETVLIDMSKNVFDRLDRLEDFTKSDFGKTSIIQKSPNSIPQNRIETSIQTNSVSSKTSGLAIADQLVSSTPTMLGISTPYTYLSDMTSNNRSQRVNQSLSSSLSRYSSRSHAETQAQIKRIEEKMKRTKTYLLEHQQIGVNYVK
ncbi:Centrosomal protein of 44 kDa [Nowakowskiella sp. JEL0407]|nr:Centrosomal protein of 44 kDa [Nowakowskiella sp. JEL0407]